MVNQTPPQQLLLRQTPKDSVKTLSGFAIYGKDITGWRTFYQLVHSIAIKRDPFEPALWVAA
jgi:hypothetical protein